MSYEQYSTDCPKKQQSLIRWLERGISRFREVANIPQSLISNQTVQGTCEVVPDDLLIKTAKDLDLADTPLLDQAISTHPDLNVALATPEAQNIMRQCIAEQQPALILEALAKAVAKLTVRMAEGTLVDPWRIMRVLLVLTSTSFCPSGAELLSKFALILNSHEPYHMIGKFTSIAMRGESETIRKMDDIILSSSQWGKWSPWFMEQAQSLAPQCWGRLVVSRQPGDSSPWNTMWDSLLKSEGGSQWKME